MQDQNNRTMEAESVRDMMYLNGQWGWYQTGDEYQCASLIGSGVCLDI